MTTQASTLAFLKPASERPDELEWHDLCQFITDITATPERLTLRAGFAPGIYRGRLEMKPGSFDMRTAMVEMLRAPDGARVPLGPWDLNHMDNVMAVPAARVMVNGKLKGALWFNAPGPDQIAEGRLAADFGFETGPAGPGDGDGESETELILEFVEHDRSRITWSAIRSIELRPDDRRLVPLLPKSAPAGARRPTVFLDYEAGGEEAFRQRLMARPQFPLAMQRLDASPREEVLAKPPGDLGNLAVIELAYLAAFLTGEPERIGFGKQILLGLCRRPNWSGRPDPLIMGGENDRIIGASLHSAAFGWECLKAFLDEEERRTVLDKVETYLTKIHDFTILQRGYMGCPTPGAHSLGTWHGVGMACMAFYDDLPIARRALPFFHGLFLDSLTLFPESGKAPWVTFYPRWISLYFAAACTFAGSVPELKQSPYLDRLAQALMTSFLAPNAQEMQRGKRTVEHRMITAFLSRFHPTPGIASVYAAFAEAERKAAGDLLAGLFDLLHAPEQAAPAPFPHEPLYASDIGEVIAVLEGKKRIATLLHGGNKNGAATAFRLHPHAREKTRAMGDITLRVNESPVIIDLQGSYGLFSANRNTLCFEGGCGVAEGQYLHGELEPEKNGFTRRCLIGERFIYTEVDLTLSIKPSLRVRCARRTVLQDRRSGVLLVFDRFEAEEPLRFATHLHCPGTICRLSENAARFNGGQANLIAGIKGGQKGLSDAEAGELYVELLEASSPSFTTVEEPFWIPAYIYGINGKKGERFEDARFPKLQRWRLEAKERVARGSFLFALTPEEGMVELHDGFVSIGDDARCYFAPGEAVNGWSCEAEAAVVDNATGRLLVIGATRLNRPGASLAFRVPVDVEIDAAGAGLIHSPAKEPLVEAHGLAVAPFRRAPLPPRSANPWQAAISALLLAFLLLAAAGTGSLRADDTVFRKVAFYEVQPAKGTPDKEGKLPEAAWTAAPVASAYYEYWKPNPALGRLKTELRMLYDTRGLYLRIVNHEERMEKIRATVVKRGVPDLWKDDCAQLYFDPLARGVGYINFTINSLGARYDVKWMDTNVIVPGWRGDNWQAWTQRGKDRWSIDAFFPWSDLGSQPGPGAVWMFNHCRFGFSTGSLIGVTWAPGGSYQTPENFGYLYFTDGGKVDAGTVGRVLSATASPPWIVPFGDGALFSTQEGQASFVKADALVDRSQERLKSVIAKLRAFPDPEGKLAQQLQEGEGRAAAVGYRTPVEALEAVDTLAQVARELSEVYWARRIDALFAEKTGVSNPIQ